MSDETTRNFWQVWRSFQWPEPVPVSYRLYHDEHGLPLFYTMEDAAGTYIEVDHATYALASHNVRVRDGRLIVLESRAQISKLRPDPELGTPCDPRDVCVVVDVGRRHKKWIKQLNDQD